MSSNLMDESPCELCSSDGGRVLVRTPSWRIVDAADPMFAGFTRVIWNSHCREMTDLDLASRSELMEVVFRVEHIMRRELEPHKINLASLGNQVPHVHWHVIARWKDDIAFPAPVWKLPTPSPDKAAMAGERVAAVSRRLRDYHAALINEFHSEP